MSILKLVEDEGLVPSDITKDDPFLEYYNNSSKCDIWTLKTIVKQCLLNGEETALITFFKRLKDYRYDKCNISNLKIALSNIPESLRYRLYSLIPKYGDWLLLFDLMRKEDYFNRRAICQVIAKQLYTNIKHISKNCLDCDLTMEIYLPSNDNGSSNEIINEIINEFNAFILQYGSIEMRGDLLIHCNEVIVNKLPTKIDRMNIEIYNNWICFNNWNR